MTMGTLHENDDDDDDKVGKVGEASYSRRCPHPLSSRLPPPPIHTLTCFNLTPPFTHTVHLTPIYYGPPYGPLYHHIGGSSYHTYYHILTPGTLEPTYRQLQTMKLDKSPFVIISVIGQELLAQVIKISKYQGKHKISQRRVLTILLISGEVQRGSDGVGVCVENWDLQV